MILGIDLGGTKIRAALLEQGVIVDERKVDSLANMTLEESLAYMKSGVIAPFMSEKVKGIGLGVPSVVDTKLGIVYDVTKIPSWKEVHLKDELEKEFNVPVFVNNDANCFALGEKYFGEGRPYSNMVGIALGTGMGAGIIINNTLYNGHNTGAGEIGCLRYLDNVSEYYCASTFFSEIHKTNGKDLEDRAIAGDREALKLWDEYGTHLGEVIKIVLYTYDPEAIILGGSLSKAFHFYKDAMWASAANSCFFPNSLAKLVVKASANPDNMPLLGVEAIVLEQIG